MKNRIENSSANGRGKAPRKGRAYKHAVALNLRFRTKRELEDVRKAAKRKGLTLNSYILSEVLANARSLLLYQQT